MALVLVNVAVFGAVRHFDFVTWDDPPYVTENPIVRAGLTWSGVVWAFTTAHGPYWHPLTWLSHMLDVQLYGLHAGGHHLTNLVLHVSNSVLLLLLLRRMTGALWKSAAVAALFAVHPLHVESVAWVAERKDVLSTLFWILTMWAYLTYARRPGAGRYAAVLLVFALALMAKPMVVTLPLILLLLDVWPLGRVSLSWHRLVLEKTPMFALSAAAGVATIVVQQRVGALAAITSVTPGLRVANALVSYGNYLAKTLWPARLAALYPYPQSLPAWPWLLTCGFGLAAISVAAVRLAPRRPYLMMGWFWYLLTLLPVIGLVQVGPQAMVDRFTYVPLVGVFVIVVWGASDALGTGPLSPPWTHVDGLGVLAPATWRWPAAGACPVTRSAGPDSEST
jgi:protein O-mannosyl-transferase